MFVGYPETVLVQQHYGGTTFFNRSWDEYKFEFGDVTGNYWIGNERLHQLTRDGHYKLRVDLEAKLNGQWYWAEYHNFRVWDESTKYRLDIGGYSGTAGDSLAYNNGMKFSTRDQDNDLWSSHCAQDTDHGNGGGLWFKDCNGANLNSPVVGTWSFGWHVLPIGSGIADRKLLTSRLTLMLK
jgi:Fibrinogen beta and gamma chains, C-terminal globular domain